MYLHKKNNIYHYRMSLPTHIKPYSPRKELWLSLKTADKLDASYKANIISGIFRAHFKSMFSRIETSQHLSYLEIKELVQADLNKSLREIKAQLEMMGPLNFTQIANHENNIKSLRQLYQRDHIPDDEHSELVDAFCREKNINPSRQERALIQRELIKALVSKERAKVELSKQFHAEPAIDLNTTNSSLGDKTTLHDLIDKYKDEHIKAGIWNIKSQYEIDHKLAVLAEIIGNIPVNQIRSEQVLAYKEILLKLPAHASKKPEYKNLSIQEILDSSTPPKQTLSITTINKHLMWACALFNWAKSNGYITQNFFENKQFKETKRKASDFRDRFTDSEIKALFSNRHALKTEWQRWIPLILLYTGARVNEIASLYRSDIIEIDGTWVFDINENREDKRIKNLSSRRIIPIHSRLITLGFLTLIKQFKPDDRLWPELGFGKDGYGRNVSRWFNEKHKVEFNITGGTKTLHSFRHTFADELKQQKVAENLAASLLGHAGSGISYERYGKGYLVEVLTPVIEILKFSIN